MPGTYTIDVEDQVILNPGTPGAQNLTRAGLECTACAMSYPACGSPNPRSACPLFLPASHLSLAAPSGGRRAAGLTAD